MHDTVNWGIYTPPKQGLIGTFGVVTHTKVPSTFWDQVSDGQRWSMMVSNSWRWLEMVGNGQRWLEIVGDGRRWSKMVGDGRRWSEMV